MRLPRWWLWGLVAITTIVLVLVVVLAVVNPFGDATRRVGVSPPDENTAASGKTPKDSDRGADDQKPILKSSLPIVVRIEGDNEKEFPANKLFVAINTAMGNHGIVELQNREPLHLTGNQTLDVSAKGALIIRAAPGVKPVIEFDLNGSKPLLSTGSGVSLTLSGVTIVVHYPQPGATPSPPPPALINAAGVSKIERCAFKVASGPHPKGSRAFSSNMGMLDVDRCWFEGFDQAIEVAADNRTQIRISQTMILPSPEPGPGQEQAGEGYGWGVKFLFAGAIVPHTKTSKPNLILDHCTVEGVGLIDMGSSLGPGPVLVEVKQCVLRGDSLLAFNPKRNTTEKQIHWRGEANQYDIHGHSWIVHSASAGSPALAGVDITDLESWLQNTPEEINPLRTKLKY